MFVSFFVCLFSLLFLFFSSCLHDANRIIAVVARGLGEGIQGDVISLTLRDSYLTAISTQGGHHSSCLHNANSVYQSQTLVLPAVLRDLKDRPKARASVAR